MLTGKNVSAHKAAEYFLQGYYQEGKSRWYGLGALKLGLAGAVNNEKVFKNVTLGLSPDGTKHLCSRNISSQKRRAALDCTFSAPKSVSLTALAGGDEQLVVAHILAVERVLALIEERLAHTRITIDKTRQLVNAKNLVVAEFDHIETRELDPHLHTHCLVMNLVQVGDKWYSHNNDAIFATKKMLGMAYQHYLAIEVQKLGYEVEPKGHGQFEIKGYTEEQLMDFSKRRQQILAAVGSNSTWAERERVWDLTRKRKQEVKPEELKRLWQKEAAELGIAFVQPLQLEGLKPERWSAQINQATLDDAIAHCESLAVAFSREEIEKFILSEGQPFDITQLEPALIEHPELIRLQEPALTRFTTQTALQRELSTIQLMNQGKGAADAIADPEIVEAHLAKANLNEGQRQAVIMAATTADRFLAWQGVAGAGKTYALKQLQLLAFGYTLKGFAPSASAAKVLGDELGIEANTVASLINSKQPEQTKPNQLWIVDEAGLLSAKDAYALVQRADQEQARVILVGDTRQLSAVEAGNPFKSLQQAGITTAYLNESQRQKQAPELKNAIDLIAQGNIEAGFARLHANNCIQRVTAQTKLEVIANEYITAKPDLVLAGTNAERLELTQKIRQRLKDEGSLSDLATTNQLGAKNLTNVQMRYVHHFELGDMVMPTRSYKRRQLEKGHLYEVVGKSAARLTLKTSDGRRLEVDTKFSKMVYSQQRLEVAVGDRLKWTKNDRMLGRRNGQEFTVTAIEGNSAAIQYLESDRTETINLDQAQHLDYALVSTTYSSQGKSADKVLIAADSTVNKESFYVAVSRAKSELKLYTEDPERLLSAAKQTKANETVLEALRNQVKQQVDLTTNTTTAQVEQLNFTQQTTFPNLSSAQLPIQPNSIQIKNDFTTTRNTQQPRTIDGARLGRSIAASLEASDDRTRANQNRAEQLLLRARSTGRTGRRPREVKPVSDPIFQPAINKNQQRPYLPVPAGQRTKGNNLSILENQQDRSLARQLEQINRHQFSANTQTDRTVSRLGDFHANLSRADQAAQGVVAENRELDQSNPKHSTDQQHSILTNPTTRQSAKTKSHSEKVALMSPNLTDGQEWVKIKTKRPQLSQWNDRIGIVVARPPGNVYVSIDGYTLSFFETEVQPVQPEIIQRETIPLQRLEQQVQSTAQTTPDPFPSEQSTPLSPQIIADQQTIINSNQSSTTSESYDTQHSRRIDGTSIGTRISSRLEADSRTARQNRESTRSDHGLDGNFTTNDNRRHQTISGQSETPRAETHPVIRPNSQRLRELGIQLRSAADRVVGSGGQSDNSAERANQSTAAIEQNHFTANSEAAGIEQNYQRITTNYRAANSATTTNQRAASENYRVFEQRRESLKALANQMREMPLPDVATRLGLELDRHDKHKWRGEGQIISINNQKFYDHVCQKGGYGAIDLVMHVQRQNFKQAVDWLSNGATYIPPTLARSSQQKHTAVLD